MRQAKVMRVTTVPISMNSILRNQLKFMSAYFEVVGVSSYVEKDVREIKEREGIRMEFVEMSRNISLWTDLKSLFSLYSLFRRERPQIVHTHTPKAGLVGMVAAWLARVPVRLHTVAGMPLLDKPGFQRRLLELVEKFTYACAHQVYPNSTGLYNIIRARGYCPETKLRVIGNGSSNGIDTEFFNPGFAEDVSDLRLTTRNQLNIDEKDFVFCFVGRLSSDKGIRELVEAFVEIASKYNNCKMLFVGPIETQTGVLDRRVLETIRTHPRIVHPGRADDIRSYLIASDAFVFPSYREGFPNAVLQAGAMGLPCLVSNINGCNEIVVHEKNGLIFPPKDISRLLNAMQRILTDVSLYQRLAHVSREMIVTRYQQSLIWNQLKDEYEMFLQKALIIL